MAALALDPERLARRDAVFDEKRHRDVVDCLGLRMDHAGRNDIKVERALQVPAHILGSGELNDLVIAGDAGCLGVKHDHASAGRIDPVVGKSLVCDPAGHGRSFDFLDEFSQSTAKAGLLGLIARLDRMGEKPLRLDDLLITIRKKAQKFGQFLYMKKSRITGSLYFPKFVAAHTRYEIS